MPARMIIAMLVVLLIPIPAYPQEISSSENEAQTLMVKVQVGNIRLRPTTKAAVVKQAKYGDFLTRKGEEGDWFRVSWPGGEGWVHRSIVVGEDGILEAAEKQLRKITTEEEERPGFDNIPNFDKAAYNSAIDDFKKLLNENYGDSGGLTRIEIDGFRVVLYWNDASWWVAPEELQLEITRLVLFAWAGLLRDHQVTHQSELPMSIVDETKIEIRSLINSEAVFAEADGESGDVKVYERKKP